MTYEIILAPEAADVRVFYDVKETEVEILAIVPKDGADAWLKEAGEPDNEDRGAERSEE